MNESIKKWATPLMLMVVCFWGGSIIVTKIAVVTLPPATVAFYRFCVGTIILFAVLKATNKLEKITAAKDYFLLLLLGLSGYFFYFFFINTGIKYTTATNTGLLSATFPIFTAITARFLLKEQLTAAKIIGIVTSFFGAFLIVSGGFNFSFSPLTLKGDILVLLGVAAGSFDPIISKRLLKQYQPLTILAYAMLAGSILFLPLAIHELSLWEPAALSGTGVLAILYLAVFPTVIGYFIWYTCLGFLDATRVAIYVNLIPVATVILALIFLHEHLMLSTIIGSIFVITRVIIIQRPELLNGLTNRR